MASNGFLGFEDILHFFCFITQVLYNLIPITFIYQLFYGVIKRERASVIGLTFLYLNGFIYFWTSIFHYNYNDDFSKTNPLDFCNLIGFFLGLIYFIVYHYFFYFHKNWIKFTMPIISLIIVSITMLILIFIHIDENENTYYKIFNWYLGTICNILENLPLGFDLIYLIKNKISEKFTLFGASSGILNTTIWLIWAIRKVMAGENKIYIIAANSVAISLHILQFFLFFKFRKEEEDISEDNYNETNDISSYNEKDDHDEEKKVGEDIINNTTNLITQKDPEELEKERIQKENKAIEEFM